MKQLNKNNKMLKRMLILLAVLFVIVFILIKAEDFIKEQQASDKISVIINNSNKTERLKNDIRVEDGVIYMSIDDMKNFFDKYIYIEDEINEIVTTYDDKIASIGFESNKLTLNRKKSGFIDAIYLLLILGLIIIMGIVIANLMV